MVDRSVYADKLIATIDKAWKKDIYGKECPALEDYKAGAYYVMLFTYAELIARNNDRGCCDNEKYKIACIEANLACLSKKHREDYVAYWEELKKLFAIGDCCDQGIGGMIIDNEGCDAFIIE